MDLGIHGRKAIVAGGSTGMGRAAALALAREGAYVVLCARNEQRLISAASDIAGASGGKVTPVVADYMTAAGRAALVAACPDPDILVITMSPPPRILDFREIEPAQILASFEAGALGPIELMRCFIDGMCNRGYGRIVHIASIAAKHPAEFRLLSGPARAALVNYVGAVSRKVAHHGVTINTLLPGMYRTEAQEARFLREAKEQKRSPEAVFEDYIRRWRIPTRTLGEPRDIGKLAAFLCSEPARFIIGQSIVCDGGMTSGLF